MEILQRSYRGKTFRPTPEIHHDKDTGLLIVATPWGSRDAATKTLQLISEYFISSREDIEATSPFENLACLSSLANSVRISVMLANQQIYNDTNESEYIAGLELLILARKQKEVAIAQVGLPHVLLARWNQGVMPLGSSADLSFDFSSEELIIPPLPAQLLGVDMSANISILSFRPQPGDQILLMSRSTIPSSIFQIPPQDFELDQVVRLLANSSQSTPFWCATISFKG